MEVIIKNAALEKLLEDIGEEFRRACPSEYEKFIRHVQEESKVLIKPSGMSLDGCFMNMMKIPIIRTRDGRVGNMYAFIKHQVEKRFGIPDFFSDRKNYQLLCKVWKDAYVRKQKTVRLDLGALHGNSDGNSL